MHRGYKNSIRESLNTPRLEHGIRNTMFIYLRVISDSRGLSALGLAALLISISLAACDVMSMNVVVYLVVGWALMAFWRLYLSC